MLASKHSRQFMPISPFPIPSSEPRARCGLLGYLSQSHPKALILTDENEQAIAGHARSRCLKARIGPTRATTPMLTTNIYTQQAEMGGHEICARFDRFRYEFWKKTAAVGPAKPPSRAPDRHRSEISWALPRALESCRQCRSP
jgi:hypothetical protein